MSLYQRSAWGTNLSSSQVLSLGMHGDFLMSSVYAVTFDCLGLQCLAPKRGQREKWRRGGKCQPFKSPWSHCSQRGGKGLQQFRGGATHLFIFISVIRSSNQWYLEDRVLSVYPDSHKPCMSCFGNRCIAGCHRAEGCGMGKCAKSWNPPKSMQFTFQASPWKLQALSIDPEIQVHQTDSATSTIF